MTRPRRKHSEKRTSTTAFSASHGFFGFADCVDVEGPADGAALNDDDGVDDEGGPGAASGAATVDVDELGPSGGGACS